MNIFKILKISLIIMVLIAVSTMADVPTQLNYQGRLTDNLGVSVADGDYNITFNIYDVITGGTELWSESQLVTITDGLFAVSLGLTTSIDPTLFENADLWMGITVDANPEFDPRTKFVTSPYAFQAQTVALNSINSSHVSDGSLFSGDLGNEVGIAGGYQAEINGSLQLGSPTVIHQKTINCPTDGYVLALCDFVGRVQHTIGVDDNQFSFGISQNSTTYSQGQVQWYSQADQDMPTGMYLMPLSLSRVFQVSAGPNEFFFLASAGSTTMTYFYNHVNLTLLFIPTSYE